MPIDVSTAEGRQKWFYRNVVPIGVEQDEWEKQAVGIIKNTVLGKPVKTTFNFFGVVANCHRVKASFTGGLTVCAVFTDKISIINNGWIVRLYKNDYRDSEVRELRWLMCFLEWLYPNTWQWGLLEDGGDCKTVPVIRLKHSPTAEWLTPYDLLAEIDWKFDKALLMKLPSTKHWWR